MGPGWESYAPFDCMWLTNDPLHKDLRRALRSRQTKEEGILWSVLRGKRFHGLKFHRQFGLGRYILDFYCPSLKVAIELDGGHHTEEDVIKYDEERTAFIEFYGIRVVRFYNNDVTRNLSGVYDKLVEILQIS